MQCAHGRRIAILLHPLIRSAHELDLLMKQTENGSRGNIKMEFVMARVENTTKMEKWCLKATMKMERN